MVKMDAAESDLSESSVISKSPKSLTIDEQVANLDLAVAIRYMLTEVDSGLLYKTANLVKKREFDETLVDAYQVTFNCLHLEDRQKSYTANLIVIGDKIINNKDLIGFGNLHKAKVIDGELHNGNGTVKIVLVDKYITFYNNDAKYQVTVTVNKMKSKPKGYLDDGCGSGGCY